MKNRLSMKALIGIVLVVVVFAVSGITVFASKSNPTASDMSTVLNLQKPSNSFTLNAYSIAKNYRPTWLAVTTKVVKYSNGSTVLSSLRKQVGGVDAMQQTRSGSNSGKVTATGKHEICSNGKIAYSNTSTTA